LVLRECFDLYFLNLSESMRKDLEDEFKAMGWDHEGLRRVNSLVAKRDELMPYLFALNLRPAEPPITLEGNLLSSTPSFTSGPAMLEALEGSDFGDVGT
jgi:hypothetical protein